MATVNKCRPTNITTNQWCLKDMFALGEGTDIIFLPSSDWGAIKQRWLTTSTGATLTPPMILASVAGSSLVKWLYNAPTGADIETALFPDAVEDKGGLYFTGNNLIFNPTIGNSTQANGVPYQNSNLSLPVGSSQEYDELVQYLQSRAWVALKLNHDNSAIHVYGGPRGYFPKADEVSEMMMSGNNDTKGETTASFTVEKANYAIEYISIGTQTADKNALVELMGYIKAGACKDNGLTTA